MGPAPLSESLENTRANQHVQITDCGGAAGSGYLLVARVGDLTFGLDGTHGQQLTPVEIQASHHFIREPVAPQGQDK